MMASYYGYSHAGHMTASGVPFDPMGFTAAHKTLPLGTPLLVSYGGKSVEVTVNDRGPYGDGIDIDLSQAAAEAIELTGPGVAPVEVVVL
jgi:rare lipoprotein A